MRELDGSRARDLEHLLRAQEQVVSRSQLRGLEIGRAYVQSRLDARRWRPLLRGTYSTHTGPPSFGQRVWSAVLYAGAGAMASHETAAYLGRLVDRVPAASEPISITIPAGRRVVAQVGLRIFLATDAARRLEVGSSPPRTTIENTVLDLISAKARPDDVVAFITAACQRRLTTPQRLFAASELRKKMRWRQLFGEVLGEAAAGVESPLESRYFHLEGRHGLPRGARQATIGPYRRDVVYREYGVNIELDGVAYHAGEQLFRDLRRDNAAAVRAEVTLRYGWRDVAGEPCAVAWQVAGVLATRGWRGTFRRCSSCPPGLGMITKT